MPLAPLRPPGLRDPYGFTRDLYVQPLIAQFQPVVNPAAPIRDDFNRANEVPLNTAGPWLKIQNGIDRMNLTSNSTVGNTSTTNGVYYDPFGFNLGDQECYFTIVTPPAISADTANIYLRTGGIDPLQNIATGYQIKWEAVTGIVRVIRNAANQTQTTAATWTTSAPKAGDRFWANITGSLISVYVDSGAGFKLVGQVSDTTFPTGAVGYGSRGTTCRIDDVGLTGQYVESSVVAGVTTPISTESVDYVDSSTVTSITTPSSNDPVIFVEAGPDDFDTTDNPSDSNKSITDTAANSKLGQGFTPPITAVMTGGSIIVTRRGTPLDGLTIELQDDAAGSPSGSVLASVIPNLSALVQDVETEVQFNFPLPIALTGTSVYYFVTYRTGSADAVNYWEIGFSSVNELTQAKVFS